MSTLLIETPECSTCSLANRELVTLEVAAQTEIICWIGRVWITVAGQPEDIILQSGESYMVTNAASVLIEALDASELDVRKGG